MLAGSTVRLFHWRESGSGVDAPINTQTRFDWFSREHQTQLAITLWGLMSLKADISTHVASEALHLFFL